MHGIGNVLQRDHPLLLEPEWHNPAHLFEYRPRDAYPARLGDLLQSCRDVHAVATDGAVLHHDVAHVHADAEFDPLTVDRRTVDFTQLLLDRHRASDRMGRAVELHQQAVTRLGEYPSVIALQQLLHRIDADAHATMRAVLVGCHLQTIILGVDR